MTVIVFGSINVDHVARVPRIPQPGETVMSCGLDRFVGGKGANQAIAAARMGVPTKLVGAVGNDAEGKGVLDYLRCNDVDVSGIACVPELPTGQALIAVSERGENAIVVVPGANHAVPQHSFEDSSLSGRDVHLAQSETRASATEVFLRAAAARPGIVMWNAAPALPELRALFRFADIIILNDVELASYAGPAALSASPEEIGRTAQSLLVRDDQHLFVTLGARGVIVASRREILRIESRSVPVIDTTGAGDCFCGALAAALHEGSPIPQATLFATAAAAISVGRLGAASSIPMRAEVEALLRDSPIER